MQMQWYICTGGGTILFIWTWILLPMPYQGLRGEQRRLKEDSEKLLKEDRLLYRPSIAWHHSWWAFFWLLLCTCICGDLIMRFMKNVYITSLVVFWDFFAQQLWRVVLSIPWLGKYKVKVTKLVNGRAGVKWRFNSRLEAWAMAQHIYWGAYLFLRVAWLHNLLHSYEGCWYLVSISVNSWLSCVQ